MDPTAFDTLVRSFSIGATRRRVLGRLAALLPVVGLGLVLGEESEARGRSHGRNRGHHPGKGKDNRKGQRKDNVDAQSDNCGGGCAAGQTCCGGYDGGHGVCCATKQGCCGDPILHPACCATGQTCCGFGADGTCCDPANCCPTTHFGSMCCGAGGICCNGDDGEIFCGSTPVDGEGGCTVYVPPPPVCEPSLGCEE